MSEREKVVAFFSVNMCVYYQLSPIVAATLKAFL